MAKKKIKDTNISYNDLKRVFEEVINEFFDPDYTLEIRNEFTKVIEKSLRDKKERRFFPLEEIKEKINDI
ncbi:MAG: hypothetical protein ACTSQG_11785 [Promethearchaeota archaeon]